jgi:hypothetical protein
MRSGSNAAESAGCRTRWAALPDVENRPVERQRDGFADHSTAARVVGPKQAGAHCGNGDAHSSGRMTGCTLSPPERFGSRSRAKRLDVVDVGTKIIEVLT